MKKKFSVKLLTVCLSAVSVFTMASCGGSASAGTPISMGEFYKAVAESNVNFYKDRQNADLYADTTIRYEGETQMQYPIEWTYLPEGAANHVTATYMEEYTATGTFVYSLKMINDTLFLSVNANRESVYTEYDTYDAPTDAPITPTYSRNKTSDTWLFGVENDVYYARRHLIEQSGETTYGAPVESKTYITFEDKNAYNDAVNYYLQFLNNNYISSYYFFQENAASEGLSATVKKGVYTGSMEVADFTVYQDYEDWSCNLGRMTVKYNANGPVSMEAEINSNYSDQEKTSISINSKLENKSSVKAPQDAFGGYTLDEELDYSDARYYPLGSD